MKLFYICDQSVWESFPKDQFARSFWIPTDVPGKLLVAIEFPHEPAADFWESIPGVEPLPHPVFGKMPVEGVHIERLQKSIGALHGDDILTLARKAAKIHPLFRVDRV